MVTADDHSANQACQGVETIRVERLPALTSWPRWFGSSSSTAALVAAPHSGLPEVQGGPEPKANTNLLPSVGESRGHSSRRRQDLRTRPRTSAPAKASTRGRRQGLQETSPSHFRSPPGEEALPLGKGWGVVLPTPRRGSRFRSNSPCLVEVDPLGG